MEKKNSRLGVIVLAAAVNLQTVHAQDVSLHVDFTGSSFDAKSAALQGTARKEGNRLVADRLTLELQSLKSGVALRDKHLHQYLGTDQHPQATLTNVVGEGGKFKGDLTLHGVTKKGVEGEYAVAGNRVNATFKTNISDYKIEPPTYMGGSITVEDEVEIKAGVPIAAAGSAPAPARPAAPAAAKPAIKKVVAPARR